MIQIGDIKIYVFNDAQTWVDPGGPFGLVPEILWSRYMQPNDKHLVPMSTHNLLIQTADKNIIVDTGFGNLLSDEVQKRYNLTYVDGTHKGLASIGVSPDDIDIVIDTHLHNDHCTGNHRFNADDELEVAFPNAEYVAQRREYEDAIKPNERTRATYLLPNYVPLVESGQMRLLDGDTEIATGVMGVVTPGHTPAHMSIRIESQGEHAAFVCDLSSFAIHFERLGWMTSFDIEPLITLETKRVWQQWALETNALIIFPHDIIKPAGRLIHDEKGRTVIDPIDFAYDGLVT
jgi:glyoxylase-like metal-dependent hydrolase (beta-lactamase superfamily II)